MACFHFGCRKSPRASARGERAIRSSSGSLSDPRASFSFGRRGCLPSPLECEPGSLGLGKVAGRAPEPLAWSERAIRSSPSFLCERKEGFVCRAPSSASLGRWVSAKWQEEPPSLCTEREGDQGFPWLFVRPSRILFARKEGWNMPGYPQWARAVTLPVSCYRVSPSGGPCPIR